MQQVHGSVCHELLYTPLGESTHVQNVSLAMLRWTKDRGAVLGLEKALLTLYMTHVGEVCTSICPAGAGSKDGRVRAQGAGGRVVSVGLIFLVQESLVKGVVQKPWRKGLHACCRQPCGRAEPAAGSCWWAWERS